MKTSPATESSTPKTNRYAAERMAALYTRNTAMEHAIEAAGAFLEMGIERGTLEIDGRTAMAVLMAALTEDFRSAILCSPDITDDQLDLWLSEIAKSDAARPPAPAADAGGQP